VMVPPANIISHVYVPEPVKERIEYLIGVNNDTWI